ncbi:hypothetical protein HELRODRAFT_142223, partial [Helobdella robusta]|uniref:Calponin-homology (CH) domain-containing protein n=1 Tax=Helobdella robusta TaxID=6412 RepID=T1EJ51_HELRO
DKQDDVQRKTFTKWINSCLNGRSYGVVVDLFDDIKDGVLLLNLLMTLSNEKLPIEKGDKNGKTKRIHHISNIGTALAYLRNKQIKLVNINASDVADGKPSIVLGLIWTIILHFQVKKVHLSCQQLKQPQQQPQQHAKITLTKPATTSKPLAKSIATSDKEPKEKLLSWINESISKKYGLEVKDFGKSWRDGIAFNALLHTLDPHVVDIKTVSGSSAASSGKENLEKIFSVAENFFGIPKLLDPEDVDVDNPDERSIMIYVSKVI